MARRELLQSTANVDRVSREIVAFARTSDVSVDPQYGTWLACTSYLPCPRRSQFLLGAVSGSGTPGDALDQGRPTVVAVVGRADSGDGP